MLRFFFWKRKKKPAAEKPPEKYPIILPEPVTKVTPEFVNRMSPVIIPQRTFKGVLKALYWRTRRRTILISGRAMKWFSERIKALLGWYASTRNAKERSKIKKLQQALAKEKSDSARKLAEAKREAQANRTLQDLELKAFAEKAKDKAEINDLRKQLAQAKKKVPARQTPGGNSNVGIWIIAMLAVIIAIMLLKLHPTTITNTVAVSVMVLALLLVMLSGSNKESAMPQAQPQPAPSPQPASRPAAAPAQNLPTLSEEGYRILYFGMLLALFTVLAFYGRVILALFTVLVGFLSYLFVRNYKKACAGGAVAAFILLTLVGGWMRNTGRWQLMLGEKENPALIQPHRAEEHIIRPRAYESEQASTVRLVNHSGTVWYVWDGHGPVMGKGGPCRVNPNEYVTLNLHLNPMDDKFVVAYSGSLSQPPIRGYGHMLSWHGLRSMTVTIGPDGMYHVGS